MKIKAADQGIKFMSANVKQNQDHPQGDSQEIERFAVFRFSHRLGNGIKCRIKLRGCTWNPLYHGWLCPVIKQEEVEKELQEVKALYEVCIVPLPKGLIPSDPKIAGCQTHLIILEEQYHKENMKLLEDVYRYNASLRPEDFSHPLSEEEKSEEQVYQERDFHIRWGALQKTKDAIERARKELDHLNAHPGEKVFDSHAPLLIADALINERFLWNEHRTIQYCSEAFWYWNGIKYVELEEGALRQVIYSFLRDAKAKDNDGHLDSFNPNKFKVDQIVDALCAICHQSHHPSNGVIWLDGREGPDPRYLIAFRNGLLNINDYLENPSTSLIPHTPLLLNVNALTFDFDPSYPEPNEWLQFLNAIWPGDLESIQTLQEWAGYLLVHDTRFHKILLIVGPPRSGKGTIGRILMALLGAFNVVGPTLSSLAGDFGLQPFLNKMLALIADARLSSKGNNSIILERLLSISGEDPLTINRKFLLPLTVQLPTRIMIMSNELPDVRDASGALAKRYLVLTLKKSWVEKEDTLLYSRLVKELPGILLWALEGLVRLQKRGKFIQPASSTQSIEELEAMTSPIKAFVSERCVIKPQAMVSVADLFGAWRSWCDVTGYPHAGSVQSFGKNLHAAFPEIERNRPQEDSTRERCYKGISLTPFLNLSADVRGQ